jgi:ATP sulfurylase
MKFIKKSHFEMLVIFHANVIIYQNFNLPHIYHIKLLKKIIFWDEKIQINHMVSKYGSSDVKWHSSIYLQLS